MYLILGVLVSDVVIFRFNPSSDNLYVPLSSPEIILYFIVKFKEIDVFKDAEALAKLRNEGFSQMPVVSIDGEFHTGFRPDILAKVVK